MSAGHSLASGNRKFGPSGAPRSYPRKAEITRAVEAAKACGIQVTGFEIGRDGLIRILSGLGAGAADLDNEFDRWKAARRKG